MYHVKYLKFSDWSNIQLKTFMVFLTMYYMSWGLSYFYENSQLESDNVIRYKQCAQAMEGDYQ